MEHHIGQQLGNYRLTSLLGQGGFAEVYLGEHVYLKTPAAIKVLHNRLAGSAELAAFLDEARMVARLAHPHIVRVLDFGVDGETPFLVMDYAPGGTLRQHHQRGERLPLTTIVHYVRQVADALHYAHEEKVIHRDVKPENMLVGPRQEIVLSDFGIALVAQSSRYQSTQEVIGTAAYMAPEQIQGKPRPASDQYALGITVYEWLCGERPFSGSFTELCTQHLFAPVPPLCEKVPTLSPEVERVVTLALAKEPKERFESVQAFAAALKAASSATQGLGRSNSSPAPTVLPLVLSTGPGIPFTQAAGSAVAATRPATAPTPGLSLPVDLPPLPSPAAAPATRRRKLPWRTFMGVVLGVLLVVGIGTPILNDSIHRQVLLSAYQMLVRRPPDVEYTMHDQISQRAWSLHALSDALAPLQSCLFVAQGMILTTSNEGQACEASNGLPDNVAFLVQVRLSILTGSKVCGELSVIEQGPDVSLCSDGFYSLVLSSADDYQATSAIHQGLRAENSLSLEVIPGQNAQVQLLLFINGQYMAESSITWHLFENGTLFLSATALSAVSASVLFQDVKVWRVPNPFS